MERLHIKNPLHPLLAIPCSITILCYGLIIATKPFFIVFLILLISLFIAFGYSKPLNYTLMIFFPLGLFLGGVTFIFSNDLSKFLYTFNRIFIFGIASLPIITVPSIHLTRCMTQLGCPRYLTLGILIATRFYPVLLGECIKIKEAMKTRGVYTNWYRPSCLYRAFLVPLLIQIINLSDILALSLETRAFVLEDHHATTYKPIYFQKRDFIFLACFLTLLIGMVIL